jgi:hypothetical protein
MTGTIRRFNELLNLREEHEVTGRRFGPAAGMPGKGRELIMKFDFLRALIAFLFGGSPNHLELKPIPVRVRTRRR